MDAGLGRPSAVDRVDNVPRERSGRDRGTFATWDVINVPSFPANASRGTLSSTSPLEAERPGNSRGTPI